MGFAKDYAKANFRRWKGGALSFVFLVSAALNLDKLGDLLGIPWWGWVLMLLVSLNVTQFMAWRDLYKTRKEEDKALGGSVGELLREVDKVGKQMDAFLDGIRRQ